MTGQTRRCVSEGGREGTGGCNPSTAVCPREQHSQAQAGESDDLLVNRTGGSSTSSYRKVMAGELREREKKKTNRATDTVGI